jgi:hypothetical protein
VFLPKPLEKNMEVRELIDATQKYWEEVAQTILGHGKEITRLRKVETAMFGSERFMTALPEYDEIDQRKHLRKAATGLMQRLTQVAINEYSPSSSSRLEINWSEIAEAVGFSDEKRTEFDAHVFWQELEKRYGGGNGAKNAYQQASSVLIDEFRIKPETGVERRRGGIVLNLDIRATQKYSTRYTIDWGNAQRLTRTLIALKSFASWGDMFALQHGMSTFLNVWSQRGDQVHSREAFTYGNVEGGQIKITTFYNRFEFAFDAKASEKLQLFLGEFGFTPVSEAA